MVVSYNALQIIIIIRFHTLSMSILATLIVVSRYFALKK